MRAALALLLIALPAAAQAQTPADAVRAALADVRGVPHEARQYTRYLDLGEIPPAERADAYRVLCGHVQHLSRESDIVRPVIVPGTAGALLRVNTEDYGWDVRVWEQLAAADPYFHAHLFVEEKVYTVWPGGNYDGKYYAPGSFRTYHTVKRKVAGALAPWLGDAKAVAELARLTDSGTPVVRGAWLFWQTAAQQDRIPGYYDFLGVKDQKTFEALIGFDRKLAAKFGADLRASVADSGVTLQPRALVRQPTLGGAYWRSLDFRLAIDRANPLRVLGDDIERAADAQEVYGHLPSGFFATALFDGKGVRQDAAPDFIASDGLSKSNDRRVHVNVSCVRCHSNGGLKEIDDWTRNLLQPPLALQSPDYKVLRKLRQQYLRHLEPFLDRDRGIYEAAVKEATGWTSKVYAAKYGAFWERYEDARVDLKWAARDLGCTPERLHAAVMHQVQLGKADVVLSVFALKGPRARSLPVRQWLEVYGLAQQYLAAAPPQVGAKK